jgi:hypothetical protein
MNTIDVWKVDDDSYMYDVIVSCAMPTSYSYGEKYCPSFVNDSKNMVVNTKKFDMWALCAYTGTDFSTAVCVGFLPARQNELTMVEYGLKISRHESDVISLIRADGTTFFYHPSGIYFKIGKDDTDLIADKAFLPVYAPGFEVKKRSDAAENGIFIRHYNGQKVTLDSEGNVIVSTEGDKATLTMTPSGEVTVNASKDVNITSAVNVNVSAGTNVNVSVGTKVNVDGYVITNNHIKVGSGVSGIFATISGAVVTVQDGIVVGIG